jgi:hypothetical protein
MFTPGRGARRAAISLLAFVPLFAGCALAPESPESPESSNSPESPELDEGEIGADLVAPPVTKPQSDPALPPVVRGVAEKPAHLGAAQASLLPWVLTISASATTLWPSQQITVSMTANQSVSTTPLFMTLWATRPGNSSVLLARCGTGTFCSVTYTEPTPGFVTYVAELTDGLDHQSPENSLFAEALDVHWLSSNLTLTASPSTLPVGGTTTLTAHMVEIGSSPLYAEIYDDTTGTRLAICGSGTACTVTVSQAVATTHMFRAYFSQNSTAWPPAGTVEQTPVSLATWTASGYSLTLTSFFDSVTATSSINVGPTPYFIEIFDMTSGARIAVCATGTVCTGTASVTSVAAHGVAAFISANSLSLLPPNIQATSNTVLALAQPPR